MRGLEYLIYSALSACLLFVMIFLPLAPLFADEISDVQVPSLSEDAVSVSNSGEYLTAVSATVTESEDQESEAIDEVVNEAVLTVLTEDSTDVSPKIDTEITDTETLMGSSEIISEVLLSDENTLDEITTIDNQDAEPGVSEEIADLSQVDDESAEELTDVEIAPEEEVPDETVTVSEVELEIEEVTVEDVDHEESVEDEIEVILDDSASGESDGEELDDEMVGETVSVNSITNSENKFSFSENECTTTGGGTFYCAKVELEPEVTYTDRIFSAQDSEGDKEIYIEKDGELTQISNNHYDDDAPYFDKASNTAVWHRLIDGRYQIIVYDFDTEEEEQITNDRYNNMQPNRFGDTLVWQGWVGNDWEIFFSIDDEISMITDNTIHDITPSVNGTYVVWQSFENNVWQMKVYDVRTGATNTIGDSDGGSIENPRFVLVYDTKFESGDIETRGYDLKSGEVVQLASQPGNVPKELPDPDQTGEERALVTTVTQLKPKTESEPDEVPQDPETGSGNGDVIIPSLISTTTLQIEIADIATTTTNAVTGVDDITVTPFVEPIETQEIHIDDIIVTPYVEPIATTTESQGVIVSEA